LLLSLPTAAYLGQRGLTPAGLPHATAQCHLTILGEAVLFCLNHPSFRTPGNTISSGLVNRESVCLAASVEAKRVHLCRVTGNTERFHMAGDASWLICAMGFLYRVFFYLKLFVCKCCRLTTVSRVSRRSSHHVIRWRTMTSPMTQHCGFPRHRAP